jgi:hypothetical protein
MLNGRQRRPPGLPRPVPQQTASDLLLQVLNGGSAPASPHPSYLTTATTRSIWAQTPAEAPSKQSFEALPNITHQSMTPARNPSFSSAMPPTTNSPSLFGNFSPFAPSSPMPQYARPPAQSSPMGMYAATPARASDLSPLANVFSQSPQRPSGFHQQHSAWPAHYGGKG